MGEETKSLRIAVDARPLAMPNTGVAVYTRSIIKPLLRRGHKLVLVSNRELPADALLDSCEKVVIKGSRRLPWEQLRLPIHLYRGGYDIYFEPWNYGLPLLYFGKTKFILSVLDLIPAQLPKVYLARLKDKVEYWFSLWVAVKKADKIITISEASGKSFKQFFKEKIQPIHIRLEKISPPKADSRFGKYFVYLGGVDPRKNVDILLKAFFVFSGKHPEYKLVLLGKGFDAFDDLIAGLEIRERLVLPGFVAEEEKLQLLSDSQGLIYPSSIEGYGLPVAEAILCDVPVLASRIETLVEIAGETALYAEPGDTSSLARGMESLLDASVNLKLKEARGAQAAKLNDSAIDQEIVRVFEEIA